MRAPNYFTFDTLRDKIQGYHVTATWRCFVDNIRRVPAGKNGCVIWFATKNTFHQKKPTRMTLTEKLPKFFLSIYIV